MIKAEMTGCTQEPSQVKWVEVRNAIIPENEMSWTEKETVQGCALPDLVASGISKKILGFVFGFLFVCFFLSPFFPLPSRCSICSTFSPYFHNDTKFRKHNSVSVSPLLLPLSPTWPRDKVHELNSGELSNLSVAYLEQAFVVVGIVFLQYVDHNL